MTSCRLLCRFAVEASRRPRFRPASAHFRGNPAPPTSPWRRRWSVPKAALTPTRSAEELQPLQAQLRERDEKLAATLADTTALDEELKRMRAEVAAAKQAATAQPDTHDYAEGETRDYFIDLPLKEAGWALDRPSDRKFEVDGMPNQQGKGFVDYVLWGDDGKPLALVEAKRTRCDARVGQQQAKLENGVPTDAYSLEWDEEDGVPDKVEAEAATAA